MILLLYRVSLTYSFILVGFIGIGIMGNGMARRLLGGGIPLVVWNRSKDKAEALKKDFPEMVQVVDTAAEVVAACDLNFVMLSTPEACREVYTDKSGLLAGVSSGKKIVDCATVQPEDMVWACDEISKRGGIFVEAPVSGSKVPAETGQLIFMAAGDQDLIEESKPFFSLMGKATHNMGKEVGLASKMKLIINSIMGNMLACFSEGLHLTEACGLNTSTFLEIVSQGAINSPMFALKGPKMISGEHPPNFPLKHAWKDIRFAIELCKQLNVDASMSETSSSIYRKASDQGLGDLDFAAIAEVGRPKK